MVFGREDRGLTNNELRLCQRVLTLHSQAAYPSLNLSHAVAVVLHDLARHQLKEHALTEKDPAPAPQLTGLLDDAADLLQEAGFLLPHTRAARMGKVRDLLQRAACRTEEVALFRGMVRQVRWAIRSDRP
jgi:tRNA/rRNA methyltransferase